MFFNNMKQPSISIIIPIYNVEEYIEECLDSVTSQVNSDLGVEVILINDATTDNSMSIADKYEKKYDYIRIINLSTNQGLSIARNTGIKESKGRWLWFVDSDDWLEPNAIQTLLGVLNMYDDNDIVCIQKRNYLKNASGFFSENDILSNSIQMDGKQYLKSNLQKTVAQKFIVKRQFIIDYHIEFYPNILHEDFLYVYTMLYYTHTIYVLKDSLYGKRQKRPGSITYSLGLKNAEDMITIHKELMNFWRTAVKVEDKEWYFMLCFGILKSAYKVMASFYGTNIYSIFYTKNASYKNRICRTSLQYGNIKFKLFSILFRLSPHYLGKYYMIRTAIKRKYRI